MSDPNNAKTIDEEVRIYIEEKMGEVLHSSEYQNKWLISVLAIVCLLLAVALGWIVYDFGFERGIEANPSSMGLVEGE